MKALKCWELRSCRGWGGCLAETSVWRSWCLLGFRAIFDCDGDAWSMQEADRLDRRGRCACASASVCVCACIINCGVGFARWKSIIIFIFYPVGGRSRRPLCDDSVMSVVYSADTGNEIAGKLWVQHLRLFSILLRVFVVVFFFYWTKQIQNDCKVVSTAFPRDHVVQLVLKVVPVWTRP